MITLKTLRKAASFYPCRNKYGGFISVEIMESEDPNYDFKVIFHNSEYYIVYDWLDNLTLIIGCVPYKIVAYRYEYNQNLKIGNRYLPMS